MHKAVFPEKPAVRPLAGSDYELAQDYYFHATVDGRWNVVVHVAPGFRTDGASIPRLLWRVFGSPYDPDIFPAAIAHDALYRGEIVPRRDADAAFLGMMAASGIRARKRRLVWLGVRLFGWLTWLRHTAASVADARSRITLSFASCEGKNKQTKGTDMKHMIIGILAAALAAATGCKSIEVDRRGQQLATDANGAVVKTAAGEPLVLDRGWSVDYFQHWNTQRFDSLAAEAGSAKLSINTYSSGADSNLTALVATSFDGGTKFVTAVGEAYVKIAGGGAQADTVLSVAQKVYSAFTSAGGDASKATVTTSGNTVTVSDGTTQTTCDASGNCTTGACSEE